MIDTVQQILPEIPVTRSRIEVVNILRNIKKKRRHLAKIAKELKQSFVGLDAIIDSIIQNIEVWYVMPEIITRPVIVNLWGMTGVGKTDLVRKLVRGLNFSDRFLEIQLCNAGSATDTDKYNSLSGQLACSNLEPKEPGILLLDEMQRFRTIDEEGAEIADYKFQDVWMLLSDGKFSGSTDKDDIMRVMFEHVYWSVSDEEKPSKKDKETKTKYRQSFYSAKFLKKALRIPDSVEDIMLWDNDKKIQVAIDRMSDQNTYEGADYSKTLIFISGNLDEAYKMSGDASDTNRDADVLHAFSKKINLISIKKALEDRFKPEQISRFGNTHIIYLALSRQNYEDIIKMRLNDIRLNIYSTQHIKIQFDNTVNDFVYRNGVFPSQGVRPLFSTISSHIENSMPIVVLSCIEKDIHSVDIRWENGQLIASGTDLLLKIDCEGSIDAIKESNEEDKKVSTSVHETGHAICYAKLFGILPTQIVSNSSSADSNGFIGIHGVRHTREVIKNITTVLMAGAAAEELVFGRENLSNGAVGDIKQATHIVAQAYRDWGMFEYTSLIENENLATAKFSNNNNTEELNAKIEETIANQRKVAIQLLKDHLPLLKEVSASLIQDGEMESVVFQKICKKHGIDAKLLDPEETIYQPYGKLYKTFFSQITE